MEGGLRRRKRVMAPESLLADHDETRLPQISQVLGDAGLWDLKNINHVADTQFATP